MIFTPVNKLSLHLLHLHLLDIINTLKCNLDFPDSSELRGIISHPINV